MLHTLRIVFWWNDDTKQIPENFIGGRTKIMDDLLNNGELAQFDTLRILKVDTPQRLGEEEFDPRIEYTVSIKSSECEGHEKEKHNKVVNHQLLMLARFLGALLEDIAKRDDFKNTTSLMFSAKDYFIPNFLSVQMNLAVEQISYRHIASRCKPIVHKSHAVGNDPKKLKILERYFRHPMEHYMYADFEHDRRVLYVRFPYIEKRRQAGENGQIIHTDDDQVIKVEVRYKSIRRIMASVLKYDDDNNYSLEFHFTLSSPTVIRRVRVPPYDPKNPNPMDLRTRQGDRYIAWDFRDNHLVREINDSPVFHTILYNLDSEQITTLMTRLSETMDLKIEFRTMAKPSPMSYNCYVRSPINDEYCRGRLNDNYSLMYMVEALLSRGAVVKDYILASNEMRDSFIDTLVRCFELHEKVVLEVVERMLCEIDERMDSQDPTRLFLRIYDQVFRNKEAMDAIHDEHKKEGFVRVRKVVITPTRMLFVAPELLMGNRVLRMDPVNYPLDKFLRVVFRDDDCTQIHSTNVGEMLIRRFIGTKLRDGIRVADRTFNYFGSSNSQLRDNGCYFVWATPQQIVHFRVQLGSFKIQSAPKMMSRLGQCFTQARETTMELDRRHYGETYDFIGGKNSKGDPYTFSDGVGKISMQTAKRISQELKLENCVPSCFQIRFRGYKGVLAVDKTLDDVREWGRKNHLVDYSKDTECWLDIAIKFRPSQKKFEAKRDNQRLEIVKHSAPVSISLNRPVINILDQVSSLQSQESHERVCNRIHYLMDVYLHSLTRSLIDEQKARNKLSEFPKLILYELLSDLNMTNEPFFRDMVRASVRAQLKRLRQKLQIPIPSNLGRAMFGIIDESDQLQRGQVFVQYTKNAFIKLPGSTADRVILKGPVLITKNPSIVAGDMRMYEAVDLPSLRHLNDVVVFPRWGHRPHSDEMAGSDLDGDEYSVMWDQQLYLDRNEEPFDYTSKATETLTTTEDELREKMADFFVDYIKQDSIGRIANAFLINSDMFGIKSNVCRAIADKHMMAVDFPKTGVPPAALSNRWDEDEPPERAERTPDFMEKNHEPTYISPRLNGQLFRRAKLIDDILSMVSTEEEFAPVSLDVLIDVPGACDYLSVANEHYESYAANIQSIMSTYGIRSEGELFSGHYTKLTNRISDKDNDDMSFYNTANAIEQRLFAVFGKFRRQFFETSFDGNPNRFEDVTSIDHRRARTGAKEIFRRVCSDPNENYQKLACAYYKIAYDSVSKRFLSFPWLAWDVINVVRRANAVKSTLLESKFSFDPLSEKVTAHINEYIKHRKKPFSKFMESITGKNMVPAEEGKTWQIINEYCKRHKGLDKLLFFTVKWSKIILSETITELHICLLLIQFGLNHLPCESVESVPYWLEVVSSIDEVYDDTNLSDLEEHHGGLGKKLMQFLEFLASRQFEIMPCLDFEEPSLFYKCIWRDKEWEPIHKAALQGFHQIAFTYRFDALPATKEQRHGFSGASPIDSLIEGEPFVIEVPASMKDRVVENQDLLNRLRDRSGCQQVIFRPLPQFYGNDTTRLYVSAKGTQDALNRLRTILSVHHDPNLKAESNKQLSQMMAAAVYEKLFKDD